MILSRYYIAATLPGRDGRAGEAKIVECSMNSCTSGSIIRKAGRVVLTALLLCGGGGVLVYGPDAVRRAAGIPDADGALMVAAALDDIEAVRQALARGADANVVGGTGARPILLAAAAGNMRMIRLLLAHGADVNAATPLGFTSLHHAAMRGHVDVAAVLIESGADLEAMSHRGATPLRAAMVNEQAEMIDLLIWYGAAE
jgi:uncharacterized protein